MNAKPFVPAVVALVAAVAIVALAAACGDDSEPSASLPADASGVSSDLISALAAADENGGGISVSGQGVAFAEPDVASLSLGVSTLEDTARQARDEAAALMTDLIDSLEDNGIADEDYRTTQFRIDPEFDYRRDDEPVIRGYRVTSILAVTVRDLDRVGEVIDDAVEAVGNDIRVQNIGFSVEDPGELLTSVRALAMADAAAKAKELADLAGVTLGKPVAISESTGGSVPPVFFERELAQADVTTPISPGQLEIVVDVSVTYAIE